MTKSIEYSSRPVWLLSHGMEHAMIQGVAALIASISVSVFLAQAFKAYREGSD
jgi:hypothetical protein